MKISFNWLKRYLDLRVDPKGLLDVLPALGFEVNAWEERGLPPIDKLIVGEVVTKEKHPDADRLSVCSVKINDSEVLQIVCGAQNFQSGDRVAVAQVGCNLPGDFKIKKSKIRGVTSEGMLCSAQEIGLEDREDGIMILEKDFPLGTPLNEVFSDRDVIFDLEITANRGDALSHIGIARELAAWYNLPLYFPQTSDPSSFLLSASALSSKSEESFFQNSVRPLQVADNENILLNRVVVETEQCRLYTAVSIANVTVKASPEWLRRDLESIGLRSINNIVDITNWVMFECGNPLHAFDARKIQGKTLMVRQAQDKERIRTLDQKDRILSNSIAVIADQERALAIAGVMGSSHAEVDTCTKDIILESAYFDPASIRRTASQLNLSTDSSYRFSRDVDPSGVLFATQRAVDLIKELAGGVVIKRPFIIGQAPRFDRIITLSPHYIREICGFGPDDETIKNSFIRLGFSVKEVFSEAGDKIWEVVVPSYRSEVSRPIDLVEEFLRLYGNHRIPESLPTFSGLCQKDDFIATFNRRVADYLVGKNFHECWHYSLCDWKKLSFWYTEEGDGVPLQNLLTSDQTHLRPSLIPGLLNAVQYNLNQNNPVTRFFEVGRVFHVLKKNSECTRLKLTEGENYGVELLAVAFVIVDNRSILEWKSREAADFYTAKSIALQLAKFAQLKLDIQGFANIICTDCQNEKVWQSGHAAQIGDIDRDGFAIHMGRLHFDLCRAWDIEDTIIAGECLILPELLPECETITPFRPFSLFPPITKDIALIVDRNKQVEWVRQDLERLTDEAMKEVFQSDAVFLQEPLLALEKSISAAPFRIESIHIFDVYEGERMDAHQKSVTFSIVFRSDERTLNDKEVSLVFDRIQEKIKAFYPVRDCVK